MRLGATLGYTGDPKAAAERARRLEAIGIDILWVAELYSFDGVSLMGFLSAVTERVQIGSSILPLYSRTPTLTAMSAAGVDALSGGRAILGLGASGPQVIEGWHGVPYDAPVGRTREIIEICRKVWRREVVEHDGRHYRLPLPEDQGTGLGKPLKLINHPVRDRIPIYVAALGPKNLELTAELAEGWIPLFFWPEKAGEVFGEPLGRGGSKRAEDLPPLEVVAGGTLAIGEGLEPLRDRARASMALYFGGMGSRDQNFYNQLLRRYGYEQAADELQDLYLSGNKREAEAAVPAEIVEATSLVGPAGFVKERIEAYREAGVTVLNVNPVGPGADKAIEQVREWIG